MTRPKDSKYDDYAKYRLNERLLELYSRHGDWQRMANEVTAANNDIGFARTDMNRVRNKTAGDVLIDRLLTWMEKDDPEIREKLRPEAIFHEMGGSSRDYYFNLFKANLSEWDETTLGAHAGLYLCAPALDAHSYLPSPYVRACLEKRLDLPSDWQRSRSVDIREYISKRSYLILRRTDRHYYHAAEIPMGALFPREFQPLDPMLFWEGVGIASKNSLQVILRECLSRVPKIHAILIRKKESQKNLLQLPGAQLYYDTTIRHLPHEVGKLASVSRDHMEAEFAEELASGAFLHGTSQVSISPLVLCHSEVDTVYGTEHVYHRKKRGFMDDKAVHFIRPDLDLRAPLKNLADNPLSVEQFSREFRPAQDERS